MNALRKIAIIGPPGTGKTTHLISIIKYLTNTNLTEEDRKRAEKILRDNGELLGKYSRDELLFLTFTTSAQLEAIRRITGDYSYELRQKRRGWAERIRTMHSLVWALLVEGNELKLQQAKTEYEKLYFSLERDMINATRNRFGKFNPFKRFAEEKRIGYDPHGDEQLLGNIFETAYTYAVNNITEWAKERVRAVGDAVDVEKLIEVLQRELEFLQAVGELERNDMVKLAFLIREYEMWKLEKKVIDYPSTLARVFLENYTLKDSEKFKGTKVLIIDEAQDLSKLQWAIIRQLIENSDIELVIVAGDPLQAIYSFQAADVKEFLEFIKDAEKHVLDESYRLPILVQTTSLRLIPEQLKLLEEYGIHYSFNPRQSVGKVTEITVAEYDVEEIVDKILSKVLKALHEGKTVFVLARTNEVARELEKEFYERGIAVRKIKNVKSLWERVEGILETADKIEHYDENDAKTYVDLDEARHFLKYTVFAPLLKSLGDEKKDENREHVLDLILSAIVNHSANFAYSELFFAAIKLNIEKQNAKRLVSVIGPKNIAPLLKDFLENPHEFIDLTQVARMEGKEAAELLRLILNKKIVILENTDRLFVDTMHSSKGSEADLVILIDFVKLGRLTRIFGNNERIHEEKRVYYVGMTRAKEELVIVKVLDGSFLDAVEFKVHQLQLTQQE
ncbi:ATP-dependent helicase, partial [Thermococcus sp. LS2]|uniref:UvrD-helicase domain-containing protein n=1 Tax=Thermococcus sp. LS2 TaxID=1638260 RepID=UPI00143A2986|nr:ATP-dependent helicase [Thermococcus sp. LS2]